MSKNNQRQNNGKQQQSRGGKARSNKRANHRGRQTVNKDERYTDPDNMKPTSGSNDVSWYAHNPEMLRAAASLPFSVVTGAKLPHAEVTNHTASVPGVFSMMWVPSIGGHDDDAINAAKESTYSFTVHANSRNTAYTSSDQMEVIVAGAQVFSFIALGIRAYGTMKLYDQRSKYLPSALIKAMGFSFPDLQKNLSRMWFDLNELIARSAQIWIPNTFPFIERWFWLNSNIYMDSNSVKGQYYVFTPYAALQYNATLFETGGALTWVGNDGTVAKDKTEPAKNMWANQISSVDASMLTWDKYMTLVNGMINALLNDEDRGIIMGDILKAYGAERIYALSPIPSDFTVMPVHDVEVLTQIENLTTYGGIYDAIIQDQTTEKLKTTWPDLTGKVITMDLQVPPYTVLNFHQIETPTPEQIMVATRLKVGGSYNILSNSKFVNNIPETMGTEYVKTMYIVSYNDNNSLTYNLVKQYDMVSSAGIAWELASAWAAFDWAPWIYRLATDQFTAGSTTRVKPEVASYLGEFDNYTIIEWETLKKMHLTAVYSEFGVPTIS